MVPFPLFLPRGFFSHSITVGTWSSSWRLISQNFKGTARVDNSQSCLDWASSNSSTTVHIFLPSTGSHSDFYLSLWSDRCYSLYSLVDVSSLGGSCLPCVLTTLIGPKIVDFSICSAFYLLGLSGGYQASYMTSQKTYSSFVIHAVTFGDSEPNW